MVNKKETIKPEGLTTPHLHQVGIPVDYWTCDFNNYKGSKEPAISVINYLEQLDYYKEKGIGLLLVGPNGSGKTTLAMIAIKYLIRARWTVYTTSLGQLVEDIQRSWKEPENEAEAVQKARESDFLLIDDIGKEHRGQSGFVQTVFDNLIRYRVQHRLPTFLTSNLTKTQLNNIYGESVMSLLEGKLKVITVNGRDYRRTIQKDQLTI